MCTSIHIAFAHGLFHANSIVLQTEICACGHGLLNALIDIFSNWLVQENKQASKHTQTHAQCSHVSVGLTQDRPNKCHHELMGYSCFSEDFVS